MFDLLLVPSLFLAAAIGAIALGAYYLAGLRAKQDHRTEVPAPWRNTGSFKGW